MIKLIYGIFIATFLLFTTLAYSDEKIVVDLILPAKNTELNALSKKISDNPYFTVNTYINNLPKDNGEILIIVSEKLLPLLTNTNYRAKFALYVNSNEYQKSTVSQTAALFSDQPLQRQLSLVNSLFGNRSINVGVAYKNENYGDDLQTISKNFPSLIINTTRISDQNIIRSINKIIQKNDVLLSTPEHDIYNSETIRSILLSSYRHQTLVIGPTEGFVTAGALATTFSTSDQYAYDIVSMVKQYIETNEMPSSQYPSNFSVKINYSVAESLGLSLPSEEELAARISDTGEE